MKEVRKFRNGILGEREGREGKEVKLNGEEGEEEGDEGWMSHDLKFVGLYFLIVFFFFLFLPFFNHLFPLGARNIFKELDEDMYAGLYNLTLNFSFFIIFFF